MFSWHATCLGFPCKEEVNVALTRVINCLFMNTAWSGRCLAVGYWGLPTVRVEDVYRCTALQEEMIRDSLSGGRTQMGQEVVKLDVDLDLPRYTRA